MAEECISVRFEDDTTWDYCWENIEPSWKPEKVTTGLRKSYSATARSWRTCQYYMKGMPAVCKYWRKGTGEDGGIAKDAWVCHYRVDNKSDNPNDPPPDYPTGFNNYFCDNLGRRDWCDKYDPTGEDNLDEYICVAPNPYLTGLGKRAAGKEAPITRGLTRAEVSGYNEDENEGVGKGKCDCYGMGRGEPGCVVTNNVVGSIIPEDEKGNESEYIASKTEEKLSELPLACNYYRPQQMGFGVLEPQPRREGDVLPDGTVTDQGYELLDQPLEYRLPMGFKLYNLRAQFQKCQWWDQDYGLNFTYDENGVIYLPGDPDIFDANDTIIYCKCEDTAVNKYRTRVTAIGRLAKVWAEAGGPVCNGARPDCPCYSGKWIYLTKEKMQAGMPVTANQILELRFWSADWESQEQYDRFFSKKPNPDDSADPAIFTFTSWKHLDLLDADKSRMNGKKLTLCQPASIQYKEFKPEIYITSEEAAYAPPFVETGTDTEIQRHFPSLIRDPKFPELKPLSILYPYYNDAVFDPGVCKQPTDPGHIKRHNTIYGDSISVIGHTVRDRKVYALNISMIDGVDSILYDRSHTSIFSIKKTLRDSAYSKLINAVYNGLKNSPQYISNVQSDDETGYFILSPVKLKYNNTNIILICVDYGDGTWEFRKREVNSLWYGGIIKQTNYTHAYQYIDKAERETDAGFRNQQPLIIDPTGTATLNSIPTGNSSVGDVMSVYSHEPATFEGTKYYGYSIVETLVEDLTEDIDPLTERGDLPWGAIGNSNLTWVQIEDKNLNYVYSWEVRDAWFEPKTETDDEGNEKTIRPEAVTVYMEEEPIDQNSIPPNACILKPKGDEKIRFLPSEWQLHITYVYQELVNEDIEEDDTTKIISGANSSVTNQYRISPFSLTQADDEVGVDGISTGPVALMAYFKDENDRIISSMATKVCLNIVSERCRNVDIFYKYEAAGRQYALQPESGFCVDIRQDKKLPGLRKHTEIPDCGDHDMSDLKWQGPMWYPFNGCRGFDMYDEFTVCNNCQATYYGPYNEGMIMSPSNPSVPLYGPGGVIQRRDYRYCGPHRFDAWGATRGNWTATCDCGCRFYYSDADKAQVIFKGYGRIRGPILLSIHRGEQPPFGNEGRELIEKFISHDYIDHYLLNSQLTRAEWMPMIMDNSAFYMTFNAFDTNIEDENYVSDYSLDSFYHANQLNFLTLTDIGETVDYYTRYRFDDLFDVQFEGNCSYPKPTIVVNNIARTTFYYFKPWDVSWAWQEAWKDIYRDPSEDVVEIDGEEVNFGKLDFVLEYERPKYVYSINKEEHRLICDERRHTIVYTAPTIDPETGGINLLPTISLDGQHPRPFEIFYSDYDSSQVTWKDEGGGAKVDGSSTKDEEEDENLYEKAMGDDWLHDQNILFDIDAKKTIVEAAAEGRKVTTGIDDITGDETYQYYNRGIIANIPRNRLDYLPKDEAWHLFERIGPGFGFIDEEYELAYELDCTEPVYVSSDAGPFIWENLNVTIETYQLEDMGVARLVVKGRWGYGSTIKNFQGPFVKPAVNIIIDASDGYTGAPRGFSLALQKVTEPEAEQNSLEYTIDFRLPLGPVEMITRRTNNLQIILTGAEDHYIYIDSIELYTSEEYIEERSEFIDVWERKYIASKFTIGNDKTNLDGLDNNLHYNGDLFNSGLYVRFKGGFYPTEEVVARDKMRAAYCGIYYSDDKSIEINYDNLHDVEEEEQQYLYNYAFDLDTPGDNLTWSAMAPPKFTTFIEDVGAYFPTETGAGFRSDRLEWEDHSRTKSFEQYDYWRPGGHYYTWNPKFKKTKCTLFGPEEDVFSGFYVHVDHLGIGTQISVDPSQPVDPGNSYASLRLYVKEAKYNRFLILSGQEREGFDLVISTSPYLTGKPAVRLEFVD